MQQQSAEHASALAAVEQQRAALQELLDAAKATSGAHVSELSEQLASRMRALSSMKAKGKALLKASDERRLRAEERAASLLGELGASQQHATAAAAAAKKQLIKERIKQRQEVKKLQGQLDAAGAAAVTAGANTGASETVAALGAGHSVAAADTGTRGAACDAAAVRDGGGSGVAVAGDGTTATVNTAAEEVSDSQSRCPIVDHPEVAQLRRALAQASAERDQALKQVLKGAGGWGPTMTSASHPPPRAVCHPALLAAT
jgi:hypothetical protein